MDLNALNKIAKISVKPILKVAEMSENTTYPIKSLKVVFSNKINKRCIVCELEDSIIYLPKRLNEALSDSEVKKLGKQHLGVVYLGSTEVGKINKAANLKFVSLDGEDSNTQATAPIEDSATDNDSDGETSKINVVASTSGLKSKKKPRSRKNKEV